MNWNGRKAIVTGGAGFIGSHICEQLLNAGARVVSIDNYLSGSHLNVGHLNRNPMFTEAEADVTDPSSVEPYMEGVDTVFHNAASKKTICLADPRRDLDINGKGTFNMLELARKHEVRKFVHASTGSVYGETLVYPQTEAHPLKPVSYYGVSKLAGERYVDVFKHLYGMNTTILRYFHVYGPRQNYSDTGGVVSIFIRNVLEGAPILIHGDGSQVRSFTYVGDVVAANKLVAQSRRAIGQEYNCASGVNVTIQELADKVIAIMKPQVPRIRYDNWAIGDIKNFQVDSSKLRSIGASFDTSIDVGLRETAKWLTRRWFANKNHQR